MPSAVCSTDLGVQLPEALVRALLIRQHLLDLILHTLRLHVQETLLSAAVPGNRAVSADLGAEK